MDEPGFTLAGANVAVIGLGLMGGSIALGLKSHCARLTGLDIDQAVLDLADRRGVVDRAGSDPREMLADADLIILACPVPAILDWLERLPEFVHKPCVVLDIGSSKRAILAAMDNLPSNFDPLGGHAICGKEKLSLRNAEAAIFKDAPFVFVPLERSGGNARRAALQLAAVLGARLLWTDAGQHDAALAATSHLPFLLASALVLATPPEAKSMIGPGFRSAARLAGTPASMMLGVLETNRDQVLLGLRRLQVELEKMESALVNEDTFELKARLDLANQTYQEFIY